MLVQKYVSVADAQVLELDIASGKLRDLSVRPANGTAGCQAVGYMPGERAVLMTSDIEAGKQRLFLRDLKSNKVSEPIPALAAFELDGAGTNDTREYLVAIANEDGYGVMRAFSLPDLKPVALPPMERGVVTPADVPRLDARMDQQQRAQCRERVRDRIRQGGGVRGAAADLYPRPGHRSRRASRFPSW